MVISIDAGKAFDKIYSVQDQILNKLAIEMTCGSLLKDIYQKTHTTFTWNSEDWMLSP